MARSITAPFDIMLRCKPTMFAMPVGVIAQGEQFRYTIDEAGWMVVKLPTGMSGYHKSLIFCS